MKQKLLKSLCLGMAAVLSLSTFSGCGNSGNVESSSSESLNNDEKTESETQEKTNFTIAVKKHALSKCDDFNEMKAFQMAEEATGVHIDWMYVEDGANDKISAMLTADLPDAFLGLLGESQIAMNMNLFADLSGLLEENAPHVVSDYNSMENNGIELLTWPDGSIRTLMIGSETSSDNDPDGIQFINKAWLDQLGLDVPTTTEELYEVLCAFRDNDMNGNGDTTDEIPLELCENNWAAHVMNFANPWGIAGASQDDLSYYYKVEDGKVLPTIDTDEYRAYLEYMHTLVSEGLLDVEFLTQTNDQYYSKLKSGTVGCYSGWNPYSSFTEEEAANWVPMRVVTADDSITPVKSGRPGRLFANRTGFAITSECENVEKLLEWWDYLSSSTEIKYTMAYGEQGGCWDIDEEGKLIQKTPEGLSSDFTVENYKYTYGMVGCSTMIRSDESIVIDPEQAYTTYVRSVYVDTVSDQLGTEFIPYRFVDPDKVDERSFIATELKTYAANFRATSITDGVTDESWEAYKGQLEALQYYDWIQWYQNYCDGTL